MSEIGMLFNSARAVVKDRHAIFPVSSLIPGAVSGWEKSTCYLAISPPLGARFSQFLAELGSDGQCAGNTGRSCYVFYILEGTASALLDDRRHRLEPGNVVVVPPEKDLLFNSTCSATRVLVWQKRLPPGIRIPAVIAHQRDSRPRELAGTAGLKAQSLLNEQPQLGMSLELWTFPPGASLSNVSTDAMEAGWFLVSGQGICQLGENWYRLARHDSAWVGPYCPHWLAGIGSTPAFVLVCRELNRDPL
jgi:(S)-ureidoglycine aminohydrolase